MAVYSMGSILKKCREAKGITQEELCLGICTASALSKMEHGYREPSYVKFASLMERMGEWPEAYDIFVGDKVYAINELQGRIRRLIFHLEFDVALEKIAELELLLKDFPEETIYHQFLELQKIICKFNGIIKTDQINELEKILRWTVPKYGHMSIEECFFSHQELIILNNIAIGYGENGNIEKAIELLSSLKKYLENNYMGNRIKANMYSSVLTNLVKYLGLRGCYQRALGVANEAIDIFIEIGKTYQVALLHYDIAWIYSKMDKVKYGQIIEDEYLLSLYADLSNKNYEDVFETLRSIQLNMCELLERPSLLHLLDVYRRVAPEYYQKLKLPDRQP